MAKQEPDRWSVGFQELFDPSQYLRDVRRPILFVNGTTDFAYRLDSYQRSCRLVPEQWRHVSEAINRPPGHIWTFPEVDASWTMCCALNRRSPFWPPRMNAAMSVLNTLNGRSKPGGPKEFPEPAPIQ